MDDAGKIARFGRRIQINAVIGLGVSQIYSWTGFFSHSKRTGFQFSPPGIAITIFIAAYAIYFAIRIAQGAKAFTWVVGAVLLNAFLLLVVDFAGFYWQFGTTENFNVSLSHLDALYFAVGTLSTAGTGSITPQSQLARGLVTIQMVLDFVLVAIAIGIAVGRLSQWLPRRSQVAEALVKQILSKEAATETSKGSASTESSDSKAVATDDKTEDK